jgi:hypothetical protein
VVKFLFTILKGTLGRNFDVDVGRATCEACSATWNVAASSAFALGPRTAT